MRTLKLIVPLLLLLAACQRSRDRIPRRMIQPDKMQAIMWDMMRADQFLADFILNKDSTLDKKTESTRLYHQILALHKVSIEDFRESFSFYQSHPVLMKSIMDSIGKQPPPVTPSGTIEPKLADDSLLRRPTDIGDTGEPMPIKKLSLPD